MKKNSNIKVTFLIESLSDGGAERVTSLLANALLKNAHSVNIIILNQRENEYYINSKVNKIYLKNNNDNNKVIRIFNKVKVINSLLNSLKSDIVISLAMPQTNALLLPSLLSLKKKVILSERNDPSRYPNSFFLKKLRSILYLLANSIVFQTEDARSYFNNKIKNKGVIILNPIKEDLPLSNRKNVKKEIVNFCRLDTQKNLPMLIDAFELLIKDFPDYTLMLYGKGPLEEELKVYANKKVPSQRILFNGYSNNIHESIKDSAMFVSSSNYEGISNSMLESLAMGLPTISTDCPVGGARMVIRSYENGVLVSLNNIEELYRVMKEIIENKELSDTMAENALKIREQLSLDNIANKWNEVVKSVLQDRR